jgi:transposase-like protein
MPDANGSFTNADKAHITNLYKHYGLGYAAIATRLNLKKWNVQAYIRRHLGPRQALAKSSTLRPDQIARIAKLLFYNHKEAREIADILKLPLPTIKKIIAEQQAKRGAREAKGQGGATSSHASLTPEQAERALQMRAEGIANIAKIARDVGVSRDRMVTFFMRNPLVPAPLAPLASPPFQAQALPPSNGTHRRRVVSIEQRAQALALRAAGKSMGEVADTLGLKKGTLSASIYSYLKSQKLKQYQQALPPFVGQVSIEESNHANSNIPTIPHATDREEVRLAIARAVGYTDCYCSVLARQLNCVETEFKSAFAHIIQADFVGRSR